jgi:hypothetical protein
MTGEVVYLFAYDIGHEVISNRIGQVLGQQPIPLDIRQDHTTPREFPLHKPLSLETPSTMTIAGRPGRIQLRIYEVGVVSIVARFPISAQSLEDLTPLHRGILDDNQFVEAATQSVCQRVIADLGTAIVNPVQPRISEAYTAFVLVELDGHSDVPNWVAHNSSEIAGLLSDVPASGLSGAQVAEVLRHQQSFENSDVVVVDWDAALVVDLSGYVEDILHVMELANLQLEEFRVMDAALDRQLARAYGLMERLPRFLIARPSAGLRQVREMGVDLARLADEVMHITKFLGDWYLARVYLSARERFHLDEWRASVAQRLRQLNDLYSVIRAEVNERRMLWLEAIIVIFFAIDLLAIFFLR